MSLLETLKTAGSVLCKALKPDFSRQELMTCQSDKECILFIFKIQNTVFVFKYIFPHSILYFYFKHILMYVCPSLI